MGDDGARGETDEISRPQSRYLLARAWTGSSRAARRAGMTPNTSPVPSATPSPAATAHIGGTMSSAGQSLRARWVEASPRPSPAEAPAAEGVGTWLDGYLFSLSGPIYAGTNEIQRDLIGMFGLGLPRAPRF